MLCMKNLENSGNSETDQITQYIGLGPPSWLTPTPQYVAHVSYLTTCKAPPETPCSTLPHPDQEARVAGTHQGLKIPGFILVYPENRKTQYKPEKPVKLTGKHRNCPGSTGFNLVGINPPTKWVPNTSPLISH